MGLAGTPICAIAAGCAHCVAVTPSGVAYRYGWGFGDDYTLGNWGCRGPGDQLVPREYSALRVMRPPQ